MNASELRRAVESALLAPDYHSAAYVNDYLKVHMARFAETVGLLQLIMRPGMRIVDWDPTAVSCLRFMIF